MEKNMCKVEYNSYQIDVIKYVSENQLFGLNSVPQRLYTITFANTAPRGL